MLPATYYILKLYGPCLDRQYTTITDSNFFFLHPTDIFENLLYARHHGTIRDTDKYHTAVLEFKYNTLNNKEKKNNYNMTWGMV